MIVKVDSSNLREAAYIHSVSWQESHRSFCTPEFLNIHTPEHQQDYLGQKIANGSSVFMLIEERPTAVVSVTNNLIEDLYVLPEKQNRGTGTKLLKYAMMQCAGIPTLWILENNVNAERLYRRMGFRETGKVNAITDTLNEKEFALLSDGK